MNPILEKWLAEKQAEEIALRKSFLEKQGLVDPAKTKIAYKDVMGNILSEEEAQKKKDNGMAVEQIVTNEALDLTEEEYKQVLMYAHPETPTDGEATDHELLKRIAKHTGVVSTILIVYVILSVILGIIIGIGLGSL